MERLCRVGQPCGHFSRRAFAAAVDSTPGIVTLRCVGPAKWWWHDRSAAVNGRRRSAPVCHGCEPYRPKEVVLITIDIATLIIGIAMLVIAFAALVVQIIQAARK